MNRLFFTLFFFLTIGFVYSQSEFTGIYQIYKLPTSSRIAGLGGKAIAIPEVDINFATVNPSALTDTMSNQFAMNYTGYLAGVKYGNFIYGYSLKERGNLALGLQYLDYGSYDRKDEYGNLLGEWKGKDYVISLIWSKELFEFFSIGASAKPLFSRLDIYKSFGIAFDLGASFYNPKFGTMVSLVVKDLGKPIKPYFEELDEDFKHDIQLGVSTKLKYAPFRFSFVFHNLNRLDLLYKNKNVSEPNNTGLTPEVLEVDYSNKGLEQFFRHLIFGVEIIPVKSFYMQIGYNHQRRAELKIFERPGMSGFSLGFGISIKKIKIGYAYSNYIPTNGTNHISISTNLSDVFR